MPIGALVPTTGIELVVTVETLVAGIVVEVYVGPATATLDGVAIGVVYEETGPVTTDPAYGVEVTTGPVVNDWAGATN